MFRYQSTRSGVNSQYITFHINTLWHYTKLTVKMISNIYLSKQYSHVETDLDLL